MKGRSCLLRCGHTRINDLTITANKWVTIPNNFNFQPKQDKEKTLFWNVIATVLLLLRCSSGKRLGNVCRTHHKLFLYTSEIATTPQITFEDLSF